MGRQRKSKKCRPHPTVLILMQVRRYFRCYFVADIAKIWSGPSYCIKIWLRSRVISAWDWQRLGWGFACWLENMCKSSLPPPVQVTLLCLCLWLISDIGWLLTVVLSFCRSLIALANLFGQSWRVWLLQFCLGVGAPHQGLLAFICLCPSQGKLSQLQHQLLGLINKILINVREFKNCLIGSWHLVLWLVNPGRHYIII